MLTALFTPTQTPVEIIGITTYPHRRGKAIEIRALEGQPFKAYTNADGDTAMTDITRVPKCLLSDIRHDGIAP